MKIRKEKNKDGEILEVMTALTVLDLPIIVIVIKHFDLWWW